MIQGRKIVYAVGWLLPILAAIFIVGGAWAAAGDGQTVKTSDTNQPIQIADQNGKYRNAKGDENGTVNVREMNPDRTVFPYHWDNILTNASLAAGVADSNAVAIHTLGYPYLKIVIKCFGVNVAANVINKLGLQFREVVNGVAGDTLNTASTFRAFNLDSLSTNSNYTTGQSVNGSATVPYSGEYAIRFQQALTSGTATSNPGSNSGPSVVSFMLDDLLGCHTPYEYLQIRVRNLSAGAVNYKLTVIGFAK